jgi:hypothetical protein
MAGTCRSPTFLPSDAGMTMIMKDPQLISCFPFVIMTRPGIGAMRHAGAVD